MPLVLSGTNGVQDNSGAFVRGTAVNSTSGTSITFTSIPSWAKRVTVMFNGVSINNSGVVQIRIGTSGGVIATGYSGYSYYANTGGAIVYYTGYNIDGTTIGAAGTRNGIYTIVNITGNTWVFSGTTNNTDSGTSISAGNLTLGGVLDRVQITTSSGTDAFDTGIINILYE
jgi:hypothetical protein